jgi:hypothetical protein
MKAIRKRALGDVSQLRMNARSCASVYPNCPGPKLRYSVCPLSVSTNVRMDEASSGVASLMIRTFPFLSV